jgi:DNA-binding Lrp family transcriptional regulator
VFKQLDDTDRKIIALLQKDARMSNAEISRHVNISRVAVGERIQQLVKTKVIQEFTAIVNAEAMGFPVAAFFEIEVLPAKIVGAARELTEQPEVIVVYQMTGPSSLHVHANFKDPQHLGTFVQKHITTLPGVQKLTTYLLMQRFKSVLNIR